MTTLLRLLSRPASIAVVLVLLAAVVLVRTSPAEASAKSALLGTSTTAPVQRAGLVLNDSASDVSRVPAGTTYDATVQVRAADPPASGEILVEEVSSTGSTSHTTAFLLEDSEWTTVTAEVVTEVAGARLNLSVHVFDGASIEVSSSALSLVSDGCSAALPSGTAMGTSMSWDGRSPSVTLAELDDEFGGLEAVRVFDPGLPTSWSSARAKATAGRTLIQSFRPMPQDVLSGKYDAELRAYFAQAPTDQTIYWSYIHEPEPLIDNGTFTADQYRRAWRYIAAIADDYCRPNMHATLILTGWTASPSSGRSVSTYYAGDDIIDVIGWDPYNGVHDADRDYYISAESLLGDAMRRSQEMGKPWAMAETGSRLVAGDSGSGRAAWLTEVGTYLRKNGAVYATYFNSTRDANWVLEDSASQRAWAKQIDLG